MPPQAYPSYSSCSSTEPMDRLEDSSRGPNVVSQTGLWQNFRQHWKIAVAGQIISVLIVCCAAAQSTLSLRCTLSAPALTNMFYYAGLAGFLLPLRRSHARLPVGEDTLPPHWFLGSIPLEAPAWIYGGIAILDVYASYFTVLAFKYTTITSVSLLTALAVPSTVLLSYFCLQRRYTAVHILGLLICLAGIVLNVLQDYQDEDASDYPHKFRGDLLALVGGFLYGANDVLGEVAVQKLGGPREYLGTMGFFAAHICLFQMLVFERNEALEFFSHEQCSSGRVWGLVGAFVMCNFTAYVAGAHFLQVSEATFFNLSLQTGGFWSVGFSVLAEHIVPKPLFYVALILTVVGVCTYEMAPTPVVKEKDGSQRSFGSDASVGLI